jgi:hypothetical protein
MTHFINTGGLNIGRYSLFKQNIYIALMTGEKVLVCSETKEKAIAIIENIKMLYELDNINYEHKYSKDRILIFENEMSDESRVSVKTTKKYIGTLCYM